MTDSILQALALIASARSCARDGMFPLAHAALREARHVIDPSLAVAIDDEFGYEAAYDDMV